MDKITTLEAWYSEATKSKSLTYDEAQLAMVRLLDKFISYFRTNPILRLFKTNKYHGYYVYGAVGSGKSMIVDNLYRLLPTAEKCRVHFHEFMENIQDSLAQLKDVEQPLEHVGKELRKKYQVIFLDEMHVNDIATAMIINNLFSSIIEHGVYLVITSNFAPHELYLDGLLRERFLPAVELIEAHLAILHLESNQDYRFLHDSNNQLFFVNVNASNTALIHQNLEQIFTKMNAGSSTSLNSDNVISIHERMISCVRRGKNVIWFDFIKLCGDMRSQIDYLELIQHFEWIIVENIPKLSPEDKDLARRFTWLIDILYDARCKVALSCQVGLEQIYTSGDFSEEFKRTLSRLNEMHTSEYLKTHSLKSNVLAET
jgi:cell division protein ZapE